MLVNSEVKYIQSLGQKKNRDAEEVFVAEGAKIINELLVAENTVLVKLFVTQSWIDKNSASVSKWHQDKIQLVKESELERISFLKTPNLALGVFKKPVFAKTSIKKTIILLLDEIQDPGNLGTIIRTADWFNVKKVICSKDSADLFSPKVVQSTMGSLTRVEVAYDDLLVVLNDHPDIPVYAATLGGDDIFQSNKIKSGFILIGNESKGVKTELLQPTVRQVTIPRLGNAESLNAAVAAGIIMGALCGNTDA